ncbi:MAG: epoxyqueuosine reductase QueH [Ruminococcus sp.]|jgi:predicted adenine nucleotide alpha hydrolase (AANH) superfamily ATPase
MKENYQKLLDKILEGLENREEIPSLLLHSCCAPCSSYVLEYLSNYFHITVFYYNPNISLREEYEKRAEEQKHLIQTMAFRYPVKFLEGEYHPEKFFEMARGMEELPEKGERCYRCYRMRLLKTARLAAEKGFDYFCTTLSISPMKNAQWINDIGRELEKEYSVKWLCSDFKKKEGYKRSIELSEEYGLYRQNYCGCVFSKK